MKTCVECGEPLPFRDVDDWGGVRWFHSEQHRDDVAEETQAAYRD